MLSFGSGLRIQGSRSGFAAFFIGRCLEVAFKSSVTSHSYDTREGIVSHVWCQILRLSPHLFWLGLFKHRAFSFAQDDDTRGRIVSRAGGIAAFLEDGNLVSQPSPLGEGAPQGRIGHWRYEREWGNASQGRKMRVPPSPMGKTMKRERRLPRIKAFPAWGRWRAKRAG